MKYVLFLIMVFGCAQAPVLRKDASVSVNAALNQAQASYLKGCVDAFKELKLPIAFPTCRDKALIHRQDLDETMGQDL